MKKSNTFFLNDKLMTESYQISSSIYSFYKQLFLFESQIEKKILHSPSYLENPMDGGAW